jgi:hypothetical protein
MIAGSCLLAALIELGIGLWLLGELQFLIPYRVVLITLYGRTFLEIAAVLYVDFFGLTYHVRRKLFLKDTGRKLEHLRRFKPWRDDRMVPDRGEDR